MTEWVAPILYLLGVAAVLTSALALVTLNSLKRIAELERKMAILEPPEGL